MNRFGAFATHLGISLIIFFFLAYLVVYEWYPGFFFDTDGGWRGMRIIIGVDLVLGPLLTLCVYKRGKPGLKFDLTCIGALQIVCLIAGTYIVWAERPLAIVYVDSRFEVMTADDYKDYGLPVPSFEGISGDDPKWVMVDVPEDADEQSALRKKWMGTGASLSRAASLYRDFDSTHPSFIAGARDVEKIRSREGGPAALQQWVDEHGGKLADYNFYTLSTRYAFLYMGFRESTGAFTGFLEIKPL